MKKFLTIVLIGTLLNSCSVSNKVVSNKLIQKRKYNKGFYIPKKHQKEFKNQAFNYTKKTSKSYKTETLLASNEIVKNIKQDSIALKPNVNIEIEKRNNKKVNNYLYNNITYSNNTLKHKKSSNNYSFKNKINTLKKEATSPLFKAKLALTLNLLFPGLGSLFAGEILEAIPQLLMSLFGFSNITLLLPYFWGVPIIFGIASFIGSYIWGMLTAKDLKVKAESNSLEDQQGDEKARIKQKSKLILGAILNCLIPIPGLFTLINGDKKEGVVLMLASLISGLMLSLGLLFLIDFLTMFPLTSNASFGLVAHISSIPLTIIGGIMFLYILYYSIVSAFLLIKQYPEIKISLNENITIGQKLKMILLFEHNKN